MPIPWLPWGEEAFNLAKKGDKPILLAITSPFPAICRTMDRDTWADEEVARLAQADYVCVRVDADRHPDVNERYNCGALPSTVFLTPEGDLLWGATFIARDDMKMTLARLKAGFETNRAKLAEAIKERDTRITRAQLGLHDSKPAMSQEIMRRTLRGIIGTYDPLFGGFGKAPKLPLPASLETLFQAYAESGGSEFEGVLVKTLDVLSGRLYDPAEGGFFACSRNETWMNPETEKTLVDQAALVRVYLDASVLFEGSPFLEPATMTLSFVRRRLYDAERGLFLAGMAADMDYYVLEKRAGRTPPEIAPGVYVDANAFMVSTLLRAAAVTGDDTYAETALKALQKILTDGRDPKGGIAHTFDGVGGLLRDHVAVTAALLDAYEWSADDRFYAEAERLLDFVMDRFWDRRDGGLIDRIPGRDDLGELVRRRRRIADASLAAMSLVRIGRRPEAQRVLESFPDFREDYGHHSAEYAMAVDALVRPSITVTLEFPASDAALPGMRSAALRPVMSRRVVRHVRSEARRAVIRKGEQEATAASPAELRERLADLA